VIRDIEQRRLVGIERYGTPLQAHNGRNPLVDAYQESLDQTTYLRQALEEQNWGWLSSTKELQEQTYRYESPENMDDSEVCNYIDWNLTAAVQELAELRVEFHWKPWATDPAYFNRERIIEEAVDTLHFIGNILHGVQCSDEEFWAEYRRKQEINKQRAASKNYSAKKGGLGDGSDAT
jgi:hypothetical protein